MNPFLRPIAMMYLFLTPQLTIIKSLDATKADGISIRMLKGTAAAITASLTMLFNISIRTARSPNCWNKSSIVPIPKASEHNSPSNYRPLSNVSKILERHMHFIINKHLEDTHPISVGIPTWPINCDLTVGSGAQMAAVHAFKSIIPYL